MAPIGEGSRGDADSRSGGPRVALPSAVPRIETFRGVDQRLRRSRSDTRSYSRRPAERSKSLRLHRPHLLFLDSRVERRAGRALSSTNRIATRASHSKFAASGIPALGRTRY